MSRDQDTFENRGARCVVGKTGLSGRHAKKDRKMGLSTKLGWGWLELPVDVWMFRPVLHKRRKSLTIHGRSEVSGKSAQNYPVRGARPRG